MSISVVLPFARVQPKVEESNRPRLEIVQASERSSPGGETCTGLCFHAMQVAYEAFGGSLTTDRIVQKLRACSDQPISVLAHWIVDREIVLFTRHGHTLIPTFQFAAGQCARRADVAVVITELRSAMDDWELASWFVTPNTWLKQATPISLIDLDARRVHEAARVDRFIACG